MMSDLEVPDADGAEQAQPVAPTPAAEPLTDDPEAPEADALEQAREVPSDPAEEQR
jgi:hypothetical protein